MLENYIFDDSSVGSDQPLTPMKSLDMNRITLRSELPHKLMKQDSAIGKKAWTSPKHTPHHSDRVIMHSIIQ
jgi:hypothetical protein